MGCGSSNQVVAPATEEGAKSANGAGATNGHEKRDHGHDHDHDHDKYEDLPTVVLPETPIKPKPPIAFDIPVEELSGRQVRSPPPHLQRLLQPPQADITLPDIQEKLAEAEMRRQMIRPLHISSMKYITPQRNCALLPYRPTSKLLTVLELILQQRAASAQKRSQKMMKSLHEMDRLDSEHETMEPENKHSSSNTLKIPSDPVAWGDRNI